MQWVARNAGVVGARPAIQPAWTGPTFKNTVVLSHAGTFSAGTMNPVKLCGGYTR